MLLCCLLTVTVFSSVFAGVIFSDDFNDNSITAAKWTYGGTKVIEENGTMKLDSPTDVTVTQVPTPTSTPAIIWKKASSLRIYDTPALGDDGHFYAMAYPSGSSLAKVGISAFDSNDGSVIWGPIIPNGCSNFGTGVSIGANGLLYSLGDWNSCGNGRLVAFNSTNGSIAWDHGDCPGGGNTSPHPRQTPALDEALNSVYFGSSYLCSVNMDSGVNNWAKAGGYYIGGAGIAIDSSHNVIYGTCNGNWLYSKILSYNNDGVLNWNRTRSDLPRWIGGMTSDDNILMNFGVSCDLAAWDINGNALWEADNLLFPVTDEAGNIYASSSTGADVVALNADKSERWRRTLPSATSSNLGFVDNTGHVYAIGNKVFYAINTVDGTIAWSYTADADLVVGTLAPDGRIFLSDANANFYLLDTHLDYAASVWPIAQYGNRRHTGKAGDILKLPTSVQSVLSVTPSSQAVSKDIGTTTFSVSNTGTGTMPWTAAVTPASSWLSITSGASGADAGTINCGFTENPNTSARTATIRVTAAGATGSPVDVTVTQAPTVSGYVDNGDGTVTDTPNGLMWQQATAPNTYDWAQASSYCESLSFAGYTDWRLPTIDELKSLLALGWHPTINPVFFPDTAASWYWSGVTHISDTNSAWVVYFGGGGDVNYNNKSGSFYVRAVRGGQPGHSVISVSPANRDVAKDAGATTFSVSNTGTGTMPWTAAVTGSWLSITSGASGTNSGTINCSFTANTSTSARTATIRVTATGATGSPVDVTVTQTPAPATAPGVPTVGTATAGNAQATVSFTPPASNGGSPITGYTVTSNPGGKTATNIASPITIVGLINGTPYTFTVIATNVVGSSAPSASSNSVIPCTVPGAPTIGAAIAGNAQATVSFTPPASNGGSPITGYTVTSNPGGKTATGSASPITITGLTNGTAYTFIVTAANAGGSSAPSASSNSVIPFTVPGAPTIGTATAGNAQATVSFTPPASNGGSPITGYTVTSNPGGKTATGIASPMTITGLINGTPYTFVVTATNAGGSSAPSALSNSVTPCTVPGAPTIGTATAGNAQATVSFTPPASNGGSSITGYTVTSNPGGKTATGSASPITITGLINDTHYTFTVTATNAAGTSPPSTASNSVTPSAKTPIIGSNSINAMDVVKITDMSGLLPNGGMVVTVSAWDKDGKQLTEAGYAPPLSIYNHGTSSVLGRDLEDRFPDGAPAAYSFSVESAKMFITNVNNSIDGAVKVPIIYSNGLSDFVSNSIGTRNTLKVTDMSGTIDGSGITITITAWDASGKAIPESASATPLKLYSHGTTTIAGSSLPARFLTGVPMTYQFTIASPKLVISNVKNSSDGTLNIPTVYTVGVSSFVSNSIGYRNTIYISDFSGTLDTDGAAISVRAWDVSGTEIPESVSVSSYKIFNYETVTITGAELGSRFSSGTPMTYQFTVDSSKVVITNVKSSTDGSINIPTVHTSGITNYTTNYVSDLSTIRITDMSGGIPAGGASITITARDGGGILIPESGSAIALKLNNHGTTTIEGNDLRNRFPSGTPVTYEFSIGSPIVVVTNLTESTGGTINIPTVFTLGHYGGI